MKHYWLSFPVSALPLSSGKTLFDFQLYVDAHAQQALEFERPLILAELLVDRLTG